MDPGELAMSTNGTWGELFHPPVSKEGIGGELEWPVRPRLARDSYDLRQYELAAGNYDAPADAADSKSDTASGGESN